MNNQNNPYPEVTNQPLLGNQQSPQLNQGYNQGYMPPNNYQQPPPPPPPYGQGYNNQGYNPNQGFNPNNQGYNPNQGYIPGRGLLCPVCRRETDNFPKKVPGGVTWIWCFCLFIFTGLFCCIPFCVDSCLDTELVCVVCQCVKARQEAKCC